MATIKKYLDYQGLSNFKTLIQTWANGASQLGYKQILKSSDGDKLYLFTDPNATLSDVVTEGTGATPYVELGGGSMSAQIGALATALGATWDSTNGVYTLDLSSNFPSGVVDAIDAINNLKGAVDLLNGDDTASGSVAKAIKDAIDALDVSDFALASVSNGVVTIKGIKEADGKIAASTDTTKDVTLAKVATTGAAEDVSYSATIGSATVTNVDDALDALVTLSADGTASKTIYMTDNTSTVGTDYATIYKIYQGSTGSAASPEAGELIGTINIPKDQFVESAGLVDVTFDSTSVALKDNGTDVTDLILGSGVTPTAADAGKYVKLVFAITSGSSAKNTIYISVKSLVDVYTGGSTSEIAVTVNASTNVITADIVKVSGTKVVYKAAYTDNTDPSNPVQVAEETVVQALDNIGSIPLTGDNSVASLFA